MTIQPSIQHPEFTLGHRRHAPDHSHRRGLPGAVGTEEAERLAGCDLDVDGIDVVGDEAILKDETAVGYVSSGGYAHRVGRSMAMGYVASSESAPGTVLDVEILGEMYSAEVLGAALYDATGANMRN